MRETTIVVADLNNLLVTVARTAPLSVAVICAINNNYIDAKSVVKQADAGVYNTTALIPRNFGMDQWYTKVVGNLGGLNSTPSRLDQLLDVVEGAEPQDNAVLTYNAEDDKYYVKEISFNGGDF